MNSDFDFDPWASTAPEASTSFQSITSPKYTAFRAVDESAQEDDFDDFDDPPIADGEDDGDFGDFGDFEEQTDNKNITASTLETSEFTERRSLPLTPESTLSELTEQVDAILAPLWRSINTTHVLSNEPMRRSEGLNQVLVYQESRDLYKLLLGSPLPISHPPSWTQSLIRRQHLISLGIPVNLDEMLPQVNGKALPALHVTTRPSSAPPGPRHAEDLGVMRSPASNVPSRSGTPQLHGPSRSPRPAGLGQKPFLDEAKVSEILSLQSDRLSLLPIASLQAHAENIGKLTVDASTLLAHLLQSRDALQQDSETYNGLIAELVGEAQKKTSGLKGKPRRASGMA